MKLGLILNDGMQTLHIIGVIIEPNPFLLQSVVWIGIFLILEDHDVLRVEIGWFRISTFDCLLCIDCLLKKEMVMRRSR